MEKAPSLSCRNAALGLLARREHSTQELQRKLDARGYGNDEIDTVLADLHREHLLSDERFTEEYVRFRVNKGFGPVRLKQELAERGISAAQAAPYLEGYDWFDLAAEARVKRFGHLEPDDFKHRAKQMRFLQYRGFTAEQIRNVFKQNDWE